MKIAFDIEKMAVGCVLLQATYGCDPGLAHRFPLGSWLLAPTRDLKVYEVDEDQLKQLVSKVEARIELGDRDG